MTEQDALQLAAATRTAMAAVQAGDAGAAGAALQAAGPDPVFAVPSWGEWHVRRLMRQRLAVRSRLAAARSPETVHGVPTIREDDISSFAFPAEPLIVGGQDAQAAGALIADPGMPAGTAVILHRGFERHAGPLLAAAARRCAQAGGCGCARRTLKQILIVQGPGGAFLCDPRCAGPGGEKAMAAAALVHELGRISASCQPPVSGTPGHVRGVLMAPGDMAAWAAVAVRCFGWRSRANSLPGEQTTGEWARENLWAALAGHDAQRPGPEDEALAARTLAAAGGPDAGGGDFALSVARLAAAPCAEAFQIALLAAACGRRRDREDQDHLAALIGRTYVHAGAVGEFIEDCAEVTAARPLASDYGRKTLLVLAGDCGAQFVWFCSASASQPHELKPGDRVSLRARVKEHRIRDGVPETVLQRARISAA